jgi:hypothetical protein
LGAGVGLTHAVVMGSYFTHFERQWSHLQLAQRHPYILSRVEQQRVAAEAGTQLSVSVLELPYIFGAVPGRTPLWSPLVRYIRSTRTLLYPQGGTACVSARAVAQATISALGRQIGFYADPVVDENLTWTQMLQRLAAADQREIRVLSVPGPWLSPVLWGVWGLHSLTSRQTGLDPRHVLDLVAAQTFLDCPRQGPDGLRYDTGLLDDAFRETVRACTR